MRTSTYHHADIKKEAVAKGTELKRGAPRTSDGEGGRRRKKLDAIKRNLDALQAELS